MPTALDSTGRRETVSFETVEFLAELARLPAIQEGEFDLIADIVCRRCLQLIDARFVTIWRLNRDMSELSSVRRYDRLTGESTGDIALPTTCFEEKLSALRVSSLIASDDVSKDQRYRSLFSAYLKPNGIVASLDHVIRVSGVDVGLVSFERTSPGIPWMEADFALARGVCTHLSLSLINRQKAELERKSSASTALQSAILENTAHAVIATDMIGTITFFNRAAEKMLGYRSEDVVGKATPALFHDPQEMQQRAKQLSESLGRRIEPDFNLFIAPVLAGLHNESDWIYIGRDGKCTPVRLSVTAIRDTTGKTLGYLGMASDITEWNRAADRLRQSEEMLSRVLLQSPDAILITAIEDGRIIQVNPGFEQITGYTASEAIGRTTIELDIWVSLDERERMLTEVKETGEIKSMPVRIRRRTGETRQCNLWGRLFIYNGTPALLAAAQDNTNIIEAEQKARHSERILRSVIDAIPTRVYWKDRNSIYLGCNEQFAHSKGLENTGIVAGKTDMDPDWFVRAQSRVNDELDRRVMATGETAHVRRLITDWNQRQTWVDATKIPLKDESGAVVGLLGIQHDITAQLADEDKLRASEDKLRSLFVLSPLGLNLQDMEGRYLEVNDAFAEIVGFDREELLRMNCYDIIPESFLMDEPQRLRRLQETGIIPAYEKAYRRKDGSLVPVSTSTVLITGPGGTQLKWTIVEDITARRQVEDAQRRNSEELERQVSERTLKLQEAMEELMRAEKLAGLGSLVAGVAHEISTPIGNANLATSTLAGAVRDFEEKLDGRLTRSGLEAFLKQVSLGVDIAQRNIGRVAGLIQNFKQVAVDQTSSQRRTFLLSEVIDEIITTMQPSLRRTAVDVQVAVDADLLLDSYPGPLGQVLTNLLNNALVHAFGDEQKRPPEPTICIKAQKIGADRLRLDVSDNGSGIPASFIKRVFDPFFTSKLGKGGSGLGLHIVRNIVTDMLAGSISVTSEPGEGTTFSIEMPRVTPFRDSGSPQ